MVTQTPSRATQAGPGPVAPVSTQRLRLSPLPGEVRLEGGFWGHFQALNRQVTIPHGMRMLAETGSLENLRLAAVTAAGGRPAAGGYSMPLFRDSDVYKTLEAIAWERARGRDAAQERFFAEAVSLAGAAQRPDGYLNSYVEVVEEGRRFTNPAMGHELYCAGHLLQAAVADLRTGGDPDGLAAIARRFAGLLLAERSGELAGFVPGHPEIETALVEFARAAGQPELISLAADLIARRGRAALSWHSFGPAYFSDDVPFAQADGIRGHAVRALYLLSGAVDVYTEAGEEDLLRSALRQWEDMVAAKTYLTGGVGARHKDEAFGEPFELPPDRAYCETCAAIASVMWNWRLLLVTGQARFADLIERTLCNGFLAGLGLDGESFFYVNPLHSRAARGRQPWYQCACCPPNIMRLLASLDHYVATSTRDGVQIHLLAAGCLRATLADAGPLTAELSTGFPSEGWLSVRITEAPAVPAGIAIRVPRWASGLAVRLNGRSLEREPDADGYLRLRQQWSAGDQLTADFGVSVQAVRPDRRIDAIRACVAFERGPLVYCFEAADLPRTSHPGTVSLNAVAATPDRGPATTSELDVAGHRVTAVTVPGLAWEGSPDGGWPYRDRHGAPPPADIELRAVPYYAWANRGPGEMRVWVPEER